MIEIDREEGPPPVRFEPLYMITELKSDGIIGIATRTADERPDPASVTA